MVRELKQNTAVTVKFGPCLDDTDGKTAETVLSIAQSDIRLTKNGGDIAQSHNNAGATHDELGYYDVPLDETDTNTLGCLEVIIHKAGALPRKEYFYVVTANYWDSKYSNDKLQVDVAEISGDSDAADNLESACDGGAYNVGGGAVVAASVTTKTGFAPTLDEIDTELSANHGAGAWGASAVGTITYPDPEEPFSDENGDPMVGVKIEAHSDSDRTALVDVQTTDINGNFQFHLNAGNYWFRASLPGCETFEWEEEIV